MPITAMTEAGIQVACGNPECSEIFAVDFADLVLGDVNPRQEDPDCVWLPPCAKCGAVEQLVRTPSVPSVMCSEHLKAVNTLGERLKSAGRTYNDVHPDAPMVHDFKAETPPRPEVFRSERVFVLKT